jgi:hypothetical protein
MWHENSDALNIVSTDLERDELWPEAFLFPQGLLGQIEACIFASTAILVFGVGHLEISRSSIIRTVTEI